MSPCISSFGFLFLFWIYVVRLGLCFPLGLWFCFGFMVFVWVKVCVFPLGLCYSYVPSFGFMICLCSFRFGYKIIWDGRGEVCIAQRAREELWRENPFLTTTTTQLARGLSCGGCTENQG